MAEADKLGDFFKAKAKKKIKASNLNKDNTTVNTEEKKTKAKATEDDAWEEEQVVASTMKVGVAGNLPREEDKKDEEDNAAPAWGNVKQGKQDGSSAAINEKKFPTLAKAVASSSINIDDGSDAKVNIATSKNVFAALEGDDDEEDEGSKRPKTIKPAMVSKKQGEREKVALQREVDKYSNKKESKKKAKQTPEDDEDDEDEDDAEAEEADGPANAAEEEGKRKKKIERRDDKVERAKKAAAGEEEEEEELEEDLKIVIDLEAAKQKYVGRKKLPPQDLPLEELRENPAKANKPKAQTTTGSKKKKFFVEEETEKKLLYIDE